MTLEVENGLFTHDRKHNIIGSNGYYDWGFCGINEGFHEDIVNDIRFFTNPEWQLQKCLDLFNNGVTFYGRKRLQNDSSFHDMIYNRFYLVYD